jgi:hypothetical protein
MLLKTGLVGDNMSPVIPKKTNTLVIQGIFLYLETFAQPEHPRLKYQKSHLKIDFLLKFLKTQAKSLVLQFKTPVLKAFHPPQADLCHRFTQ